jgi:hypothetical protein
MAGLAQLEERIAKLEAAAADIREATREAHEAIGTLRLLKKDVAGLVDEVRRLHDVDGPKLFNDMATEQIRVTLDAYRTQIREAQDSAVEKVGRTFDELARIYLEGSGGKHRDIPLPTLAERARR